jgi:O-antigen ligase
MNSIKKIIEYGLYLLVFLLSWQTRWIIRAGELNGGYWEYGTVSLYATDILLIIVLLFFLIFKILNPKSEILNPKQIQSASWRTKLQISNFWWFIVLIELAIFISIFFAPNKLLAVYGYVKFLLGIGLFWLIIRAEYNKVKLFWSLIAGAVIQAGLGIWQFITQSSFSFKWLGIAEHKPFELGTSVVETMSNDSVWERWLRAYGGLDHPNMLGGFLVMALLLLAILYIDRKSEENISSYKIFNFKFLIFKQFSISKFLNFQICQNVLCVMCYALCVFALFFTFSRGAWAGFLAGLIAIFAILFWKKNEQATKKALELIFIGAIIILFLFNLYSNLVLTRLSKDTRLEIKSNVERIESYKQAEEIIKKRWLFGVGIGNYTLYYAKYNANLQMECKSTNCEYANKPSWYYQPVHNTFLLIWAETGILGLAGFIGVMLCVMCYLLRQSESEASVLCDKINRARASIGVLNISILIALTAMMLVDHWYWSLHFGILFFWLLVGVIVKEGKTE